MNQITAALGIPRVESGFKRLGISRLYGPKGILIESFSSKNERIDALSGQRVFDSIANVGPFIRKRSREYAEALLPFTTRKSGNQATLHQHHFDGLSPIAALFVVALRYAQVEQLLTQLVADPDAPIMISQIIIPPFLGALPRGTVTRAQQIVAAYRSAILCDKDCKMNGEFNSSDVEDALKQAHAFLRRAAASDRTQETASTMVNLDLAHWIRSPLSAAAA